MEKKDIAFLKLLSEYMEGFSSVVTDLLGVRFGESSYLVTKDRLGNYDLQLAKKFAELMQYEDDETEELTTALSDLRNELFFDISGSMSVNNKYFNVNEKTGECILKNFDLFRKKEISELATKLYVAVDKYASKKSINYESDTKSFKSDVELKSSLMLFNIGLFATNLTSVSSVTCDAFISYFRTFEDSSLSLSTYEMDGKSRYLVRNEKGQFLCYHIGDSECILAVDNEKDIDRFKNIHYKKHQFDKDKALVDINDVNKIYDEIKGKKAIKKEENKTSKDKEDIKQPKTNKVKEKKVKRKKNINIFNAIGGFFKKLGKNIKNGIKSMVNGILDVCEGLSLWDILLGIVPALVMITYVILLVTGVMDKITFSSSNFDGTLFGYNFELSGLMANWLENTDHGFFSAITLGLIQIILIVVGFVLDLVLHLLFLVLAILWFILILIFSMCFYYIFPIAIAVWSIINFFRVDDDKKLLVGICMAISVICCVSYFIIGMNII